jgi:hypothetical protein
MFKITLTNGYEDLEIMFKVRDTDIAKKWYLELSKNYNLYEIDRFSNWNNNSQITELKKLINDINQYDNIIDYPVNDNITQTDLNYLHKFFENLRGEVDIGTEWFNSAPINIKKTVERLNILIHQLEADIRTTNHPTVVVTFKNRPKYLLDEKDLKHFTYRWTQGTVYINYCQVGKTVLDIFKDRDHLSDAVRPQEYYSADFMIKFGPTIPYALYLIRKIIINIWLKFQHFNFKNLNIGMIPVADQITVVDTNQLTKFNCVKEITCLK